MRTSIAVAFVVAVIMSCGSSPEQYDELVRVGTEIAAVHQDLYPAMTELGKVAVQLEDLARLQNPAMGPFAADIAASQQLIAEAFAAAQKAQDNAVVGEPKGMTHREYMAAQETYRDVLKQALGRTRDALARSREVIEACSVTASGPSARK